MQPIQSIVQFLQFYVSASTQYRVHSPFVFEFTKEVLDDDRNYYAFPLIEKLRSLMLQDKRQVKIKDYGAGSKITNKEKASIKAIVKRTAVRPFWGRILFKTILLYQPKNMLELGTSLGISTLYQAMAAGSKSHFISLEGCPKLSHVALENFKRLKIDYINLLTGRFEDTLPKALQKLQRLDYVFIDGNHKKAPTLNYFHQCLEYAHDDSLFIFDDIYWSKEMTMAWKEIQQHPKVRLSIDLYFFGMVFFRKEQKQKEHFKLVPTEWKPWVMGFWE